jgi:hypothetical protein
MGIAKTPEAQAKRKKQTLACRVTACFSLARGLR